MKKWVKAVLIGIPVLGGAGYICYHVYKKKKEAKKTEDPKVEDKKEGELDFNFHFEPLPDLDKMVKDLGYKTETQTEPKEDAKVVTIKQTDPDFEILDQRTEEPDEDMVTLNFFNDGVLADSDNRPMSKTDIAETIGKNFAVHFGEIEDDSIWIRNKKTGLSYEVIRVEETYSDYIDDHPTRKANGDV